METLLQWLYGLGIMILGFVLFKLLSYGVRTKKQTKFNIFYWWNDNKREILIALILYIAVMLFFEDVNNIIKSQFGFMFFSNKFFLLFVIGLFFASVLHRLRRLLWLEYPVYPDGTIKRKSNEDENDFVGGRPDDR